MIAPTFHFLANKTYIIHLKSSLGIDGISSKYVEKVKGRMALYGCTI